MKKINSSAISFWVILMALNLLCIHVQSQSTSKISSDSALTLAEMELEVLMMSIASSEDDNRMRFNAEFVQKFGRALKLEDSHEYPFEKLTAVSRLGSANNELRIFTWELNDKEGNIHYFGFATSAKKGEQVVVFELKDKAANTLNAEHKKLNSENWYGALYYDMRRVESKKSSYYVLLGINRRMPLIKERIVDVIYVDDELYFGKDVFHTGNKILKKRLIYQHSSETDMALLFQEDDQLVMDHLMPSSPAYKDKFEFYVPDLSFDAFNLKKGIWYLEEDYDAKLDKQANDEFYEMELPKQKKVY